MLIQQNRVASNKPMV